MRIEALPVIKIAPGKNVSLNLTDYITNSSPDARINVKVLPSRRNNQIKIVYNQTSGILDFTAVNSFNGMEIVRTAVSNSLKESTDGAVVIMAAKKAFAAGEFAGISNKRDEKTGSKKIILKYVGGGAGGRKVPLDITTLLILMDNKLLTGREYDCDMAGSRIIIRPPVAAGRHWFRVFAKDKKGNVVKPFYFVETGRPPKSGTAPRNWDDAVIYMLTADGFLKAGAKPAPGYQGVAFNGVTEKIKSGYFEKIGINTICLSPVIDSRDTVSYTDVNEKSGTMKDLRELINAAHSKNIKILLEMAVNQIHMENPLYKQHPKWFSTKTDMQFDYQNNPDAVKYMVDNCIWWIEQTGVDGFRLDGVNDVDNIFWKSLKKKIKEKIEIPEEKMFYLVGETNSSREKIMEYIGPAELNGQFDFPLYLAMKDAFGGNGTPENLEQERQKSEEEFFMPGVVMSPIMGSHNLQRMAVAFLLTLPGAPMVYYGDEIGITEGKMRFDSELKPEELKTLKFFSTMTKVRKEHPAARYGKNYVLKLNKDTYIYLKQCFDDFVIVAMNLSDKVKDIRVEIPEYLRFKKQFKDEFSSKKILLKNGAINIKIQPSDCMILTG